MRALCMLDNEGYRYTLGMLNTYGFSMAKIFMQMLLNVMCIYMLSVSIVYVFGLMHCPVSYCYVTVILYHKLWYKKECVISQLPIAANSYIYVGQADVAVFQLAHTYLNGDFLIHRRHRCVVLFVVSGFRLLHSLLM